ncbi:MAG TPA: tRNA (adenosine(37)-N6)-dimethylallyltransferase MiaA, partial [Candidatus Limnocylindrales bacterium]|nr:tRNA (adenosine(37)-N6)-dimethylallyltransferase MiaA [Candidatus Limnocylindrales bacterium]
LVLSGPTASGKTLLALSLGHALPLEIINADSLQVYRGMDIGTAKPSLSERGEIPHHLIDVADPDEEYNAGRFVAEAEAAIRGIRGRGNFPLVAGGTGLYVRALLRGLDDLPSDAGIRARLTRRWEEEGGEALFAELRSIDRRSAEVIHLSDRIRVLRALEVAAISGTPPSRLKGRWKKPVGKFRTLFIGISVDRDEMYRRIDARVDAMFRKGLVDEVRGLLSKGYAPDLKPMKALGYRHVVSHLAGGLPLPEAVAQMKRDTRRYAKRQMTWLSREPEAVWVGPEDTVETAVEMARKFLF